jgi:hypothetical protein
MDQPQLKRAFTSLQQTWSPGAKGPASFFQPEAEAENIKPGETPAKTETPKTNNTITTSTSKVFVFGASYSYDGHPGEPMVLDDFPEDVDIKAMECGRNFLILLAGVCVCVFVCAIVNAVRTQSMMFACIN